MSLDCPGLALSRFNDPVTHKACRHEGGKGFAVSQLSLTRAKLCRGLQAPSDEEIKEFCLATGGGFGSVDPTEKTFFIGYPRFRLEHHQGTGGSRLVPVLRQAFKRGTKVTNQDARTEHKIGARLAPLVRNDGKNTSRPVAAGDVNAFGTMVLAIGLPSRWDEKVDVTLQASRDCPRTMINADDVWIRGVPSPYQRPESACESCILKLSHQLLDRSVAARSNEKRSKRKTRVVDAVTLCAGSRDS